MHSQARSKMSCKMFVLVSLLAFFAVTYLGTAVTYGEQPQPLFGEPIGALDLSEAISRERADATVLRSRLVQVHFDHLAGEDLPEGAELVVLNLFDDVHLLASKERLERRSATQYTWFGRVEGYELSQVTMVVNNGRMTANITFDGQMYQVRPVGDGVHSIREIDQSAFPEEAPPIPVDISEDREEAQPAPTPDSGDYIDVLVVYTGAAASASGDIASEIQLAISETNTSYANSGINQRLRLVHSAQVTYTETGNMNTDLSRLQDNSDGYMDNAHTLRDTYGADVVSLWVENGGGYCGLGYFMDPVSSSFASWAFSEVDRGCATGYYSFGHELGHNMGARHDWYVDEGTTPYTYAHGYVNTADRWRTVMAYSSECSDSGFSCTRLQYWSNPDVSYGGDPMGVPQGTSTACTEGNLSNPDCDADNRRTLNNTAYTVANFRASVQTRASLMAGPGTYTSGGGWIEQFAQDYSNTGWARVDWTTYNSNNGEARIATGDIDGDGNDEVVVGLGPVSGNAAVPGGWFEVLDDDLSHLAWGQIGWAAYNSANGETWPACGDVDGDGSDEIVVGLGSGGGGWMEIFDYSGGSVAHKSWAQVNWGGYNTSNGETRPASGDIDGDSRDEIVVGLAGAGAGYLEALDDSAASYAHLAWARVNWPSYDSANGETWPACGDVDGDGSDEIIVGLGSGGGGWTEVMDYGGGSATHKAWTQVDWSGYNSSHGETHPASGDIDGDGRDEIVVGLASGGGGYLEVFDDSAASYAHLAWAQFHWPSYCSARGEAWPALKE